MTLQNVDVSAGLVVDVGNPDKSEQSFKLPSGISLEVGDPVPGVVGECVNAFAEIKALRIELEKRAKEVEKREDELEEHIIAACQAAQENGAVGTRYTATLMPKSLAIIEDWNNFTAWVIKTGQTQVLYKRVNDTAVTELKDAGHAIPDGVGYKRSTKLSVTKTKR